jgi:phage-related tail fiber protein
MGDTMSSLLLGGLTSGTIELKPADVAGTTVINVPATSGTMITTGDVGTVTKTMLAGDFGLPAGAIIHVAMTSAPSGYLKANGDAVSRVTYATLFAAIGIAFGSGDGSTTFNLPDLRGEFVRGWDDSKGVDAGRLMGTNQADEFKSHTHVMSRTLTDLNVDARFDAVSLRATSDDAEYTDRATNATGGTETRPRNISLLACIKF